MNIERDPTQIDQENKQAIQQDAGDDAAKRAPEGDGGAGEPQVEEVATRPEPKMFTDDKRKAIAEKAKAQRQAKIDAEFADNIASDRARLYGSNVNHPELRTQEERDAANQQPEAKRKLKVNGREFEMNESEVIALAQKAIAADDILGHAKTQRDEATNLLAELRAMKSTIASSTPEPKQEDVKPAPRKEETTLSDDDFDNIVEQIQVGDTKSAKAALSKYGEQIETRILQKIGNLDEHIAETVTVVNESTRRKNETIKTLTDFAAENPEFESSRPLQVALAQQTADTMREKLYDLGVLPETLEHIKATQVHPDGRRMMDNEVVGFAYRHLQEQGNVPLPSHGEILKTAVSTLRKQFNMPERQPANAATSTQSQVREANLDRKRAMTPQPRRATAPSAMDAQERSRDEVRAAAVRQMRAQRRGRA